MPDDLAHARAEHLAELLDMRSLLDRRCAGFSSGERMKTALARAMVHDPANLVLDEPTNGLDVLATRALRETLPYFALAKQVAANASSFRRISCKKCSVYAIAWS